MKDKNMNTHDNTSNGESTIDNTGAANQRENGEAESASEFSGPANGLENIGSDVKDTAQGLIDKAKETAGQAYETATEKAASKLDEQKAVVTSGLASVAGSIKQVGESLRQTDEQTGVTEVTAKYGDRLAGQIEQISGYFEKNDLRAIVSDVEDFARKNPAVFIGGAFALGILAARFLKSSKPGAGNVKRSASQPRDSQSGQAGAGNIVNFDSGTATKNTPAVRPAVKGTT